MDRWSRIVGAVLARYSAAHRATAAAAVATLKADLRANRLGRLTSRNLQLDPYLSLTKKAAIVDLALFFYDPTRRQLALLKTDPRPAPIGETHPRKAVVLACRSYFGLGDRITRPCGALCHYQTLTAVVQRVDTRGAEGGLHSENVETWVGELQDDQVMYDHPVLSRLAPADEVYVFSTRAGTVDGTGLRGPELSAWVRDLLGCPHFDGERLIELRLPAKTVWSKPVTKPTFADARGYPPFNPSRPADYLGNARNLREHRRRQGGPEVWNRLLLGPLSGIRLLPPPADRLAPGPWKELADESRVPGRRAASAPQGGGVP